MISPFLVKGILPRFVNKGIVQKSDFMLLEDD